MGKTSIEWTDTTWNPTRGCRRISPGCEHCYAERQANRQKSPGRAYEGLVVLRANGPRWTGEGRFIADALDQPLRWREPRRVFVDSMSDLFFEAFTFEQIAAVFGVMAAAPQHTFQVLTKRPERAVEFFKWIVEQGAELQASVGEDPPATTSAEGSACLSFLSDLHDLGDRAMIDAYNRAPWPLPNVWLGVSVEDQKRADERIPLLIQCPAAVRFLSVEPMLEGLRGVLNCPTCGGVGRSLGGEMRCPDCEGSGVMRPGRRTLLGRPMVAIDWVICGGESGHGARPMHPAWARSLRDQCVAAGVPFFFKQWGAWGQRAQDDGHPFDTLASHERDRLVAPDGTVHCSRASAGPAAVPMTRVGKSVAGRLLDGRTWDEMPARAAQP